ncbi:MAG: RibD family protein, partial [Bacteroidota bacterium]
TAICDNPKLSTRAFTGLSPTRVIIDKNLRIPNDYHLFDGSIPTIIFTDHTKESKINRLEYVALPKENHLAFILEYLYNKNISTLLVEGGAKVHKWFIDEDLWDEARVFTSPCLLESGIRSFPIPGKEVSIKKIIEDEVSIYYNNSSVS